MGYRLDDELITLNIRKLPIIARGKTGNVYRYNDEAIKKFFQGKNTMDVETAIILKEIPTERILLPKRLLFYNDSFRGYSYNLIRKPRSSGIIKMPKDTLVDNIVLLEKDIERLSEKKVLLDGLTPDNTIFSNNLYISDPRGYTILDLSSSEELKKLNEYQIYILLNEMIVKELKEANTPNRDISKIKGIFRLKDDDQDTSDFLDSIIPDNNSIEQITKKIKL